MDIFLYNNVVKKIYSIIDHDLSQNQESDTQELSHPVAPKMRNFKLKY